MAHLGLLVSEHQGHSLSLLLNSGVLALTQTILRLVGKELFIDHAIVIQLGLDLRCLHEEALGHRQIYGVPSKDTDQTDTRIRLNIYAG